MAGLKEGLTIFLKGMLMGAADIIPGISGGTIALITGIYERLVQAIKNVGVLIQEFFKKIIARKKVSYKKLLKLVDFGLFLPLLAGIAFAFLVGAWLLPGIIASYSFFVYSFFTGLILSSAFFIFREIRRKTWKGYVFGVLGVALGLIISLSSSARVAAEPSILQVFFLGMIALMAMILPGVSGAFILFLFGQYEFMLNTLRNFLVDWPYVVSFIIGGVIGLLGFSRMLSYLLKEHHEKTLFFLSGLMLGALYSPIAVIASISNIPSVFALSLAFFALGILIVLALKIVSHKKK